MKRLFALVLIMAAVALTTSAWLLATPAAGTPLMSGWESPGVRLLDAALAVTLTGGAVFSASRHGWGAAGGVVVALSASAVFGTGVVDRLAVVTAGGLALWTACANGGRGRARLDWSLSRLDEALLVSGWLAMATVRADGIMFAAAVGAIAILVFDIGIGHLRRDLSWASWGLIVGSGSYAIVGMLRGDLAMPGIAIAASSAPIAVIAGRRTWRQLGAARRSTASWSLRRRVVAAVIAVTAVGLTVSWCSTVVLRDEEGATWLSRSSLPLFVGVPIIATTSLAGSRRAARMGAVAAGVALIAGCAGLVVAARRWEADINPTLVSIVSSAAIGAAALWWSIGRVAGAAERAGRNREDSFAGVPTLLDGVNVVGYHGAASGLGVAVRRIHASLVASGVPVSIFDIALTDSPSAVAATPTVTPDAQTIRPTTIAVVTAPELPAAFATRPALQAVDRVIGYWFWEVADVPDAHAVAFDLVDEIWAPTTFVADAYRQRSDAPPVVHQPLHLAAPTVPSAAEAMAWRTKMAPDDEFVVLVALDLFSIVERKNPFAAIDAFARAASTTARRARLVIKTLNGDQRPNSLRRITDHVAASSARDRIEVIDGLVSDADMVAMVAAADCLLSLHRGEGLGLHLADAMWLGTPVIATRYSGNLDFMDDQDSLLVDARLVDARHGEDAYPDGTQWAAADIDHATRLLVALIDDPEQAATVTAAARSSMALRPSAAQHGAAYAATIAAPIGDAVQPCPDFNDVLHQLRTEALAGMPAGVDRMLSVGCAGRWYFDWIDDAYGRVREHVGIEFFSPEPDDLPDYVTWIADTASNMASIGDSSADLLFSGQNIEHLWPVDGVGFLAESNRVLRKGGTIVVDSPNRIVTERLGWSQPEHTIEFTADEITELLAIAGFTVTRVVGLWDCRVHDALEPASMAETRERSAPLDRARVDDAFVWWVEAERVGDCDAERLTRRVEEIFALAWPERLGRHVVDPRATVVDARLALPRGVAGVLVHGPHAPLSAGRYEISFDVVAHGADSEVIGACIVQAGTERLAVIEIAGTGSTEARTIRIAIDLDEMTFGIHGRIDVTGAGRLSADPTISFVPERPVGH